MNETKDVLLTPMTRALCRELFQGWVNDPAMYENPESCREFVYEAEKVDDYFERKSTDKDRVWFAITRGGRAIGELHLKYIDWDKKECTLSIHLKNDRVKGQGYGTEAERQAVRYAFDTLGMKAVIADTLVGNTRSAHVLEKVGFSKVGQDARFVYFRMDRKQWREVLMKDVEYYSKCIESLSMADFNADYGVSVYSLGIVHYYILTFNYALKALQAVMRLHGVDDAQTGSPREILKLGYKYGFVNDEAVWLEMLKMRNTAIHIYNENEIKALLASIRDRYIPAFCALEKTLKEKVEEAEN